MAKKKKDDIFTVESLNNAVEHLFPKDELYNTISFTECTTSEDIKAGDLVVFDNGRYRKAQVDEVAEAECTDISRDTISVRYNEPLERNVDVGEAPGFSFGMGEFLDAQKEKYKPLPLMNPSLETIIDTFFEDYAAKYDVDDPSTLESSEYIKSKIKWLEDHSKEICDKIYLNYQELSFKNKYSKLSCVLNCENITIAHYLVHMIEEHVKEFWRNAPKPVVNVAGSFIDIFFADFNIMLKFTENFYEFEIDEPPVNVKFECGIEIDGLKNIK